LSATRLVELLNEYLSAMTDILLEDGGTLDKYEGDAIIAFFGAPMPMEDHAVRSCRVALGMQERLADLREKWASEGDKWPPVVHEMRMRIGINTGEIVTGNMGSAVRMNYTMMGDSVNLAARLEEAAKQYGIFTQVSMFTKDWLEDKFVMRELDTMRVVGKKEPVTTYDLLGEVGKTDLDLLDLQKIFQKALAKYKNKEWDEAIKGFEESLELEYKRFPDLKGKKTNPSLIYIERCNQFKENPPPEEWDGVFTLTSK
jgi:adenylate cyclase